MKLSRGVFNLLGLMALVGAAGGQLPFLEGLESALGPELAPVLQILVLLTVLSVVPALLILTTSFTRVVIVLSFLRNALATQNAPPNQVIVALALFLTFFIMAPVFQAINGEAIAPYVAGSINEAQLWERATAPLADFMLRQAREADLALFLGMAGIGPVDGPGDVPFYVLAPAFAISELKTAFQIGFLLFLPFLVLDLVIGSSLMAMGMFMIPPMMVSLPFKLLLFVMVDGWHLVVGSLVTSFR
ncbi:MAG: flagellar type III secretion system pore protein FliP [bacterium]|nr:flagellar type III secretion system pore protein FliP [bacterium]